jgi:hypothetical protein
MTEPRSLIFEIEIRPACSGNDPPFIMTIPDGKTHRIIVFDADLSWRRLPSALEIALCSALYQVFTTRAAMMRKLIGAPKPVAPAPAPTAVEIARGVPRVNGDAAPVAVVARTDSAQPALAPLHSSSR